ncbi:MAG: porphobilinogen synthase [Lentisphaeria bacterium]|nr:porphobilinogen synthase [Lentisphaeria bacterium]
MSKTNFKRFRPRRIDAAVRDAHRETCLRVQDFIWPVFLVTGRGVKEDIPSMPGVCRYSCDALIRDLPPLIENGLTAVLLFGVPERKNVAAAWSSEGIVQQALPLIKARFPELECVTDVCLCSFTEDGHCHIGENDATCELLAQVAVSHAWAGADVVAPSDMMDGRVWYIRRALDGAGFGHLPILSYAAKYASAWYGPFRDAADCAPKSGDRKTYQMDPGNSDEALAEIAADLEEGAAGIIVKPALSYLDIIRRARDRFSCPVVAYNVSGEYAMLKRAVRDGLADASIIAESLLSIKRAGADRIISYFTPLALNSLLKKHDIS